MIKIYENYTGNLSNNSWKLYHCKYYGDYYNDLIDNFYYNTAINRLIKSFDHVRFSTKDKVSFGCFVDKTIRKMLILNNCYVLNIFDGKKARLCFPIWDTTLNKKLKFDVTEKDLEKTLNILSITNQ